MEARELNGLKLYNILDVCGECEVIVIDGDKNTITVRRPGKTKGNYIIESAPITSFDVKPIPLSEDWLKRFGAKKNKPKLKAAFFTQDRFELRWNETYNFWYVRDLETGCYITKVEFVHEWQNVWHALNGTELTLNP